MQGADSYPSPSTPAPPTCMLQVPPHRMHIPTAIRPCTPHLYNVDVLPAHQAVLKQPYHVGAGLIAIAWCGVGGGRGEEGRQAGAC